MRTVDATQLVFLRVQAVVLLALGRKHAALERFTQMLALRPLDPHALASRAHIHAGLRVFGPAIADLTRLTDLQPMQAATWFNLGYVLQQAGRDCEAGTAFRRAIDIDATQDRAWYGLALVLMQGQRWLEAATALEQNTALQPMSPHGWYRLVEVRLALGQLDEARRLHAHLASFEPRVAAQLAKETGLGGAGRPLAASSPLAAHDATV